MGSLCCVSLAQPVSGTSVLCVIVLVGTEGRLVTPSSVDDGCHVPSSLSTLLCLPVCWENQMECLGSRASSVVTVPDL